MYLSTKQIAEVLGVCQATVRKLARSGELPCVTVGRQRRFDLAQVIEKYTSPNNGENWNDIFKRS